MSFTLLSKRLSILLALCLPVLLYFMAQGDNEVKQYQMWQGQDSLAVSYSELPLLLEVVDRLDQLKVLRINFVVTGEPLWTNSSSLLAEWAVPLNKLGEATNLRELQLYSEKYISVDLPLFFKNFDELKVLRLEGIYVSDESYAPLTQLEELYLTREGSFPRSPMPALKRLDMQDMSNVYLPKYLKHMPKLEVLNFSNLNLHYIGNLVNHVQLRHLSLEGGRLGSQQEEQWSVAIPTEGVPQLRTLSIPNCGLELMPRWLLDFTELRELNLADNKIAEDWFLLEELTNLEVLNATGNPIDSLPGAVTELPHLQKVIF